MALLPQGDIFASGTAVSGSKVTAAHLWKYCPYSTQITGYNQDSRVPGGEKVYHSETEGRMHTWSVGIYAGWTCVDNDCPFYAGTAVTEIDQYGRRFATVSGTGCSESDLPTLSGAVEHITKGRIIVSGTRYFEI